MACNSRRFVLVAKVASVYTAMYQGFILPTGLPSEWPYPLCVGGSTFENPPVRYSDVSAKNSVFTIPYNTGAGQSSLLIRNGAGNWRSLAMLTPNIGTNTAGRGTWPYNDTGPSQNLTGIQNMLATPTGSFIPRPIVLTDDSPATIYGMFDGCFFCQGQGNSPESQLTDQDARTYRAFPNVFRNTGRDFWCLEEA